MNIKISVIMPVYNVEPYIEQAINSVIYQNYYNIELIIINDGSTDRTGEICDKIANLDNRIKVIHNQNQGVSKARNIGLDQSTGDYILFVDGDDYLEPNCIEEFINNAEHGIDIYICSFRRLFKNKNSIIFDRYKELSIYNVLPGQDVLGKMYEKNIYECSIWTNVYCRKFILDNNLYFDTKLLRHSDEEWFLKLMLLASKTKVLNLLVYNTRAGRLNSISNIPKYDRNIFKIYTADSILTFCRNIKINNHNLQERINLGMMSFYLNAIVESCKYNEEERKEILNCAKEYKYILSKSSSPKQKIAKTIINLLGFNVGSRLIYTIYNR